MRHREIPISILEVATLVMSADSAAGIVPNASFWKFVLIISYRDRMFAVDVQGEASLEDMIG